MAKINPVKVKQDADKLEKAGKLDKAIALYRQIIDDNPRDWNTINKIGDLYAKLNRTARRARSTRRSPTSTRRTASSSRPSPSGRRSTSSTPPLSSPT